jgi:transposase
LDGPVVVAYEAGPTGFGLYRALTAVGVRCVVAAPSKLQRPAGDRVKTDARDALHLARLLRLGEITPVAVPTLEQEAARDLVRAREDCRGDLMRARHRLSKLLLRQGIVYSGGQAWTETHDRWLRQQRFDNHVTTMTFESDYEAMIAVKVRRDRLDKTITEMAGASEFTALVRRLACLRGVSTLTAFGLAVEIGDWQRFTGNTIASFVGLVPSEHSSGASRVQGSITKTGNTHVRRLLVEAAWHHRARYLPGKTMHDRWELAPPAARARGDAGNRRLHERWIRFNLPANSPCSPTSPSPANWPAGAGLWPSWTDRPPDVSSLQTVVAARGATRDTPMSNQPSAWPRSTLDTRPAPAEQPVLR